MSLYKTVFFVGAVLLVAGCGFRPLYAPPADDRSGQRAYAFDSFRELKILPIPNREGQLLRNRLELLLQPSGREKVSSFTLRVGISESLIDLAVKRSADSSRANLTIRADYTLTDLRQGGSSFSGSVLSTSGYNILSSEYQTLVSEQGARVRALNDVAEQIRVRIGAIMAGPLGSKTVR